MENIFENKIMPEAQEMLKRAKMPENPAIAESWKKIFFAELQNNYSYKLDEKGKAICIGKDGAVIENRHGWPMEGKEVVEETFKKYFEDNGMPFTEDEYYKRLKNPSITPEERISLTNYWNKR
jgi:hypothetical protein